MLEVFILCDDVVFSNSRVPLLSKTNCWYDLVTEINVNWGVGMSLFWCASVGVGVLAVVCVSAVPAAKRWRSKESATSIRLFRLQRERLEAKFVQLAKSIGKPRGLRWIDCDWQDDVTFARERQTGLLTAFASINVRFEAIEGGDMEDVAAVGTVRDAVAVFHFQRGTWGTGGKALFNMNPREAIERLTSQFEAIPVPI
jgi:hypothetical protein